MENSRNDRSLYTDVFFFFHSFLKHRRTCESEREFFFPHPYPLALAVNKFPAVFIFYHARSTDFEEKMEGLWTGLVFLANLFRFKVGFSKLHLISNNKSISVFCLLRFSLRSSLALNWAISLFFFFFFRSAPDQTTTPGHQIRTPPPHNSIRSDHPTRPQTTILDYSASNHHSIPKLLKWYRSGAFLMGWVKGGI